MLGKAVMGTGRLAQLLLLLSSETSPHASPSRPARLLGRIPLRNTLGTLAKDLLARCSTKPPACVWRCIPDPYGELMRLFSIHFSTTENTANLKPIRPKEADLQLQSSQCTQATLVDPLSGHPAADSGIS
jgi:hypothetical protein